MKRLVLFLILLCNLPVMGQDDARLAENYMDQGEFAKALKIYNQIYRTNVRNVNVLYKLIDIHHQMKSYDTVDSLLNNAQKTTSNDKTLLIERGYNQLLKGNDTVAQRFYNEALTALDKEPGFTYQIARRFEERRELDEAILAYEKGMIGNPQANFNIQLARLYGEQGNLERMLDTYVALVEKTPPFRAQAQAIFSQYVTDDAANEANTLLRKVLLLRLRNNPDPLYNQLLSWLFVQQKDFKKAFVQEKALYTRDKEDISNLQTLAYTAIEEKDTDAAVEILDYIVQESQVPGIRYFAQSYKVKIAADASSRADFPTIKTTYESLLDQYGRDGDTFTMQLDYANFLAFKMSDPATAVTLLTALEKQRLSPFQKADVKMLLADILVLEEQFNRALILYSQIQSDLPNDTRAQESQFKVARTSYFQHDFPWSLTQLKVLRSAASKLIANDAMELSLLIADHSLQDTTYVALKAFAKADLKQYQGKRTEAITDYMALLQNHKGDDIEDEALLNLAQLYKLENNLAKASESYQKIIDNYNDGILADDALYYLGLLNELKLENPTAAQALYERIIYEHADSIHFIDARRRYRRLRGDTTTTDF